MKRDRDRTRPVVDGSRRRFTRSLGLAAGLILPGRGLLATMLRDQKLERITHSTFVMGQIANVTVLHPDPVEAREGITAVFQEFRRLERSMSVYDPASEVSSINRMAGRDAVEVSADLLAVVSGAAAAYRRSGGALDITVEPLEKLWGFRGERSVRPSDREVARSLDVVGMDRLTIEGRRVGLTRHGAAIDLGGVAVGYALDRAREILAGRGIERALIELSGDYYAIGAPTDSPEGWEIGIVDPRFEEEVVQTVRIRDQGLSTSGNYATTVVFDAKSYGHIFNPERGYPADRILSATVIAPTGFLADAYSTALFVRGETSILPEGCRGVMI